MFKPLYLACLPHVIGLHLPSNFPKFLMKKLLPFAILLLGIIAFFACNKSTNPGLSNKNFEEEIALQQNLVFTFTEDLVSDSLLNKWDTTSLLNISPYVPGNYMWSAKNELTFSPNKGFQPAQDYEVVFSDNLSKMVNKKLDLPASIKMHTPYLNAQGIDFYYSRSSANPNNYSVRGNLAFNYPVKSTEVQAKLNALYNDKPIEVAVISNETSTSQTLEFIGIDLKEAEGKTIEINIAEGLSTTVSKNKAPKGSQLKGIIPEKGNLQVVSVNASPEVDGGSVTVSLTQAIPEQNLEALVTTTPKVKSTFELLDNGFVMRGDFKIGTKYELVISGDLKGIFDNTLGESYTHNFEMGKVQPYIAFANSKSMYLGSEGFRNIALKVAGMEKIRVEVTKIYENNIQHYFRNGRWNDYYWDEEEEEYSESTYNYNSYDLEAYGDPVMDKVLELKSLPKKDGLFLLNLGLEDRTDFKGIYLVNVSSEDSRWLKATQAISYSNLGMIVKKSADEMYVFVNGINDAKARAGVEVNIWSTNNQNAFKGTTGSDGVFILKDAQKKLGNFRTAMITVKNGNDFNFLHLNDSKIQTSRFEVGGKIDNIAGTQGFIYGDRNLYRPGETAHIVTVLRDGNWKPISGIPYQLKVFMPNGRVLQSFKITPDKQGVSEVKLNIPAAGVTGQYNVQLISPTDILIESYAISVEEFMPDRISVNTNLAKTLYKNGEMATLTGNVMNLYGTAAANRNYKVLVSFKRKQINAKEFPGYTFNLYQKEATYFEDIEQDGKTDEMGNIANNFTIPEKYQDMALLKGSAFITVFDETGRPVNRLNEFDVATQPYFLGIESGYAYLSTSTPHITNIAAVDAQGKSKQNVKARVQLIRKLWQTTLERNQYGDFRYVSSKREIIVSDKVLIINGKAPFKFLPSISGEYEVRASLPDAEGYVSTTFYAYGYGSSGMSGFEVNQEGTITIETDKTAYNNGEQAKLLLKMPFKGKVLLTVERNELISYHYLEANDKAVSFNLDLKNEHLPNVFISATVFRPHKQDGVPLTVAHGYKNIVVQPTNSKFDVKIVAAEKSRSGIKQKICVETNAPAGTPITIAAVDEGILQLNNYKTPNPFNYFYQSRALMVDAYNMYGQLFPEIGRSSTGGDGYDLARRVNPFSNKRVESVAFWSGVILADGSGKACFEISVPMAFSGKIRLMTAAVNNEKFGSAESAMIVADPVVISSGIPRFLAPTDEISMPVTLSNTTEKAMKMSVSVQSKTGIEVVGRSTETINVEAKREGVAYFKLLAGKVAGNSSITVNVTANGEKFVQNTNITVRPASSLQKFSGSGEVLAGKQVDLNLPTGFLPGTFKSKIIYSNSPLSQFAGALEYLNGYPHGCLEQTISKAFPQIYLADLAKAVNQTVGDYNPAFNVNEAIRKVEGMQMYNGAFSMWPGRSSYWDYGSVYAAHFLVEAKKAGYVVNEDLLAGTLAYLQSMVQGRASEYAEAVLDEVAESTGTTTNRSNIKAVPSSSSLYATYVLALAGRADMPAMNYYKSVAKDLTKESGVLLAAAFKITGNKNAFEQLINFKGFRSINRRSYGESINSPVRENAIILNVLLDFEPANPAIQGIVADLSKAFSVNNYYTTQENCFVLLAMGKYAKKNVSTSVSGSLLVDGTKTADFKAGQNSLTYSKATMGKKLTFTAQGTGKMYYTWMADGIDVVNPPKMEDKGMYVRRTYLNSKGNEVDQRKIKQNDLIVVKITIATTASNKIENVVVTDLLPAGLEVENPRISAVAELGWLKNPLTPDHVDMRDDRVNMYLTATSKQQDFYYLTRAVSPGDFSLGPISAEAMYDPTVYSVNGLGRLTVLNP